MTGVQRIAQILGGPEYEREAREILEEAYDVVAWRENPYQDSFRACRAPRDLPPG